MHRIIPGTGSKCPSEKTEGLIDMATKDVKQGKFSDDGFAAN